MKELSVEEKAKRYDEFVNELKSKFKDFQIVTYNKNDLEKFFPELVEPNEERIRKELIEFVKSRGGFKQEYIGWLEKQGKQKSIDDLTPQEAMDIAVAKCFKEGEQKPVDKVKEEWIPQCGDIVRKKGTIKPLYTLCKETEGGFSFVTEIGNATGGGFLSYYNIFNEYELVRRPQSIKDVIDKVHKPLIELTNEQNPAWSEDDERMYRELHALIDSTPYCNSRKVFSNWLNSLKERVQPKQELS